VLARLAASAGMRVLVARSGDPAPIAQRMRALGAEATTTAHAIAESDAVVLALPLGNHRMLPAEALRGALVIDAMNYWWASDGIRAGAAPSGWLASREGAQPHGLSGSRG
jgi:predicted dinucleotide-binding enzyme